MGRADLVHFKSDDALATAVAEAWLAEIKSAHQQGRRHLVALSGGRITRKLFGEVVRMCGAGAGTMDGVHFFWADERCLAPEDAESNYRLARELLFEPLRIHSNQVHRIRGELAAEEGAKQAAAELQGIARSEVGIMPVFDLVLLGMGEDAHVASLFPGDATTEGDVRAVFLPVHNAPKPPPDRVSLGHGAIAAAREVWVLASGQGKEAALRQSLAPGGGTPLARVIQSRGQTRLFTDILLDGTPT